MTLLAAQEELRKLVWDGQKCPCCTQLAKVYKRKLNSGMARSLIVMYRAARLDWQHVPTTVGRKSAEEGKLAHWGLVEEEKERRSDGGRAGFWRVTLTGEQFVLGHHAVPKYAHIYDGRCLKLSEGPVTIRAALGSKFNYDELMQGV